MEFYSDFIIIKNRFIINYELENEIAKLIADNVSIFLYIFVNDILK